MTGTVVEWHESDAEEVVTAVTVHVLSEPKPRDANLQAEIGNTLGDGLLYSEPFRPAPVAYTYEAPEHALYGAEKVVVRPEGVDLFAPISELGNSSHYDANRIFDMSKLFDNDAQSYAGNSDQRTSSLYHSSASPIYKVRLSYTRTSSERPPKGSLGIIHKGMVSPVTYRRVVASRPLEATSVKQTVELIMPNEAGPSAASLSEFDPDEFTGYFFASNAEGAGSLREEFPYTFRVYSFEVFTLDGDLIEQVAKSHLKLPAEDPATVSVYGDLRDPEPLAALTLGTSEVITRRVASVEYALARETGAVTRVKLEQPSSADLLAQEVLIRKRDEAGVLQAVRFR